MLLKIKASLVVISMFFATSSFAQSASYEGSLMVTIETDMAGLIGAESREVDTVGLPKTEDVKEFTPNILVDGAFFMTQQLAIKGVAGFAILNDEELGRDETSITVGGGLNYSFDPRVNTGAYAELLGLYNFKNIDATASSSDANTYGAQASLGYRVKIAENFTWSPSFDFRYMVGSADVDIFTANGTVGTESDLEITRWQINLAKFDFFL